jgi:hypothetical protein
MIWRQLTEGIENYPVPVEVRSITVAEYRELDALSEYQKQDWILRHCARLDGQPVTPSMIDMHLGSAIIQGVMRNPWSGHQPNASSGC